MTTRILAVAAAIVIGHAASAHDFKVGDLVIEHPMAFATPKTAMTGGGYLSITNTGAGDDRLLAVEAAFPRVMLHTTDMQNDVASMRHVEGIVIPAGATVTFEPGGLHVMFMGLDGDPFEVGEKIPATLVFEHAGNLDVMFNVEARGASDDMDHSAHGAGH
ncbi:copper chaperone PCu(A)C [Puniceibacterium sp. IMCC21224]|uniref:copper chaperone PCu(A)C n=1 Tax=Puniceibacterium sp. IMCC21224 TaxID=1618204 RepID=UPI00064DF70F|nr:copper chaperone PCu(A)C [Puniceibacterium sp. IMCC21224]KMK68685.1 hypothetical protein IMCC21224_113569 [Puniceibacterium sp. IMCC21224]